MISQEIYKYFADFVFKKTGIFYPEKDFYRLDSRINTMMKEFRCDTPDDLYQMFLTKKTEQMERFLIDICTNNETYFFRDNKPFDALVNDIIPQLQEIYPNQTIQMWSCASSTGQEPLSIMMSLKEKFGDSLNFSLKATDISSKALKKATDGVYSNLDVQRGLPVQLLVKYFESVENSQWKVKSELSKHVSYSSFNLLTDIFERNKFHVVFCRNVLIYQNPENKQEILSNIYHALKPGGFLVMGAGESLIGTNIQLEQKSLSGCMVFQRPKE
ncbi:MAG: chemotaxis protein CheR [Halobacteriovoraceae bacterium]|nr:chemotaxis protein CheR [Halobacteriovoraceae bacterium]|tara:strand:+ start:182 stop:997 length:816 start_codon:yes stop_codon:yes gene_type:complete